MINPEPVFSWSPRDFHGPSGRAKGNMRVQPSFLAEIDREPSACLSHSVVIASS